MLDFEILYDKEADEETLYTSLDGKSLLTIPQLNKGTAFTREERQTFKLLGKLPHRIETLDEQVQRAYLQYSSYKSLMQQNIYLNNLHDKNQIVFYKLLNKYLSEMLPIIYTPIVGTAVKRYSIEYRQPKGLYIAHTDKHMLDEILNNRSNPEIDLIVVTDGEGVLGIGDQGIGGMDIPVAKLMVYTLCGGIKPSRTLPIFLDVGTNNQELLKDSLYLGCQHPRINQGEYDAFISAFVRSIRNNFPQAFLHWEDFGRGNARRILDKFQNDLCTFNDDIQGTGAVTLAALLAATDISGLPLEKNRLIVFGAGSAGTGICDQLVDAMIKRGASKEQAYQCFWLIDRQGLLLDSDNELTDSQKPYARKKDECKNWSMQNNQTPSLMDTVKHIKPTILIGCSAQAGAFSQEIIEAMSQTCEQPIIFPLSNPDEKCEAKPADLITWSQGKALIATGTAFPAVEYKNHLIQIAQCNNALIFPGIGLGILAVRASRLSSAMIWKAAETLSQHSPSKKDKLFSLLPPLEEAQAIAKHIAVAVAKQAIEENLAQINQAADLEKVVQNLFWEPHYINYRKKS